MNSQCRLGDRDLVFCIFYKYIAPVKLRPICLRHYRYRFINFLNRKSDVPGLRRYTINKCSNRSRAGRSNSTC